LRSPGIPFRSQIKDKDVDKIRAKGGRVIILGTKYTHDDLEKAKKECGINPESTPPAPPPATPPK
jgi:hypothetical protein